MTEKLKFILTLCISMVFTTALIHVVLFGLTISWDILYSAGYATIYFGLCMACMYGIFKYG